MYNHLVHAPICLTEAWNKYRTALKGFAFLCYTSLTLNIVQSLRFFIMHNPELRRETYQDRSQPIISLFKGHR